MTIRWPVQVLPPRDVAFDISPRSLAGPASVSGMRQVVSSDAGIWKAGFGNVAVNSRQRVLAWRAIDNLLEGQLGTILVPFCRGYQPVPAGAVDAGLYSAVPHDDDAFFSDDAGYVGTVIDVIMASSAALRAVTLSVTVVNAGTLQPGQHFSIGERAYRIRTVDYTSDTEATLTIRPPLRESVSVGDRLEFDDPICRMRLASDDEMNLELQGRRIGFPTVRFIEDL